MNLTAKFAHTARQVAMRKVQLCSSGHCSAVRHDGQVLLLSCRTECVNIKMNDFMMLDKALLLDAQTQKNTDHTPHTTLPWICIEQKTTGNLVRVGYLDHCGGRLVQFV